MSRSTQVGLVVAVAGLGLLLLAAKVRGSGEKKSMYYLQITRSDGVPSFRGPQELSEKEALEWQLDAQEENWEAVVSRYRWYGETQGWLPG